MQCFSTGDHPTDHNLQRLSHLASLNRFDAGSEQMHDWLCAVIMSINALPKGIAKRFTGYYHLGDSHFHMSDARRAETWRRLAEELRNHVTAAHADPTLNSGNANEVLGLADRPETLGERILSLCAQLEKAGAGTQEFGSILKNLAAISIGEIRSDVAELERLSNGKSHPQVGDRQYWIARNIAHIRLIADRLHHIAA